MSEFKGTPVPWVVCEIDNDSLSEMSNTMVTSGEVCVACVGPSGDTSLGDDVNNAQLIAAAPELLESLNEVIAAMKITLRVGYERIIELGGQCDSPEVMIKGHSEISRAESVITKALGK